MLGLALASAAHAGCDLPTVCPTFPTFGTATLSLHSADRFGPLAIEVHRITSPWMPGTTGERPEQDYQADRGDPAPFAPPMFLPPAAVSEVNEKWSRFSWDVTRIVQA